MDKFRNYILHDRRSLLAFTLIFFIIVVVIEGIVMDRESRIYRFESPYIDIQLNDIEEFSSRRWR